MNRRAFLLASAALGLAACSAELPADVPDVSTGPSASGSFASRFRDGAETGWTVAYPPGSALDARLPVAVVLHGRGGDHRKAFDDLHLDRFLAQGRHRFALASVDGGDHDYWHPRRDSDTAAMVTREFLPLLAGRGLQTQRIGFLGWSMGG